MEHLTVSEIEMDLIRIESYINGIAQAYHPYESVGASNCRKAMDRIRSNVEQMQSRLGNML